MAELKKTQGEMFSHSRIGTFETCPLKFKFRYVDRIKPKQVSQTIEAYMGQAVHHALEELYKAVQFEKHLSIEDVLSEYNKFWNENWDPGILVVQKGVTSENYRLIGERCLKDYYSRNHPFTGKGARTIGTESKVIVLLPGGERLVGYIDRLVYSGNGIYEIHDYKTNSKLKTQSEVDKDRQLALYSIGIRQQFPDAKKVALVWHFLAFDKELHSERTEKELSALAEEIAEKIKKIRLEKEFKPKESALCPYCEFQDICPKRAHLFKVKSLPEAERKKEPGSVLVEKFHSAREKRRVCEKEEETAKTDLIIFAEENKVDNIAGIEHFARVRFEEALKFPGKGEEGREELVSLLKKGGLWEKVETIDTFALKRELEEKDEIKGKKDILGLAKREIRKSVTIAKLRK